MAPSVRCCSAKSGGGTRRAAERIHTVCKYVLIRYGGESLPLIDTSNGRHGNCNLDTGCWGVMLKLASRTVRNLCHLWEVGAKFAGSVFSTQGGVFVLLGVKPAEALSFSSNIEGELISKRARFWQHFVFSSPLHASLWSFSKYTGFSLATLVRLKCPPPPFF